MGLSLWTDGWSGPSRFPGNMCWVLNRWYSVSEWQGLAVMNLLLAWASQNIWCTRGFFDGCLFVIPANNNSVILSNYISFSAEVLSGCTDSKGWELQSMLLRQPGTVLRLPLTSCLGMQSRLLHKMWLTLSLSLSHTHRAFPVAKFHIQHDLFIAG